MQRFRNLRAAVVAAVVTVGLVVGLAGAASADPRINIPGDPTSGALGATFSMTVAGCQNPGGDAYVGQFVNVAGDRANTWHTFESAVAPDGSWSLTGTIPLDNGIATFEAWMYCASAPVTVADDPAILWMSSPIVFQIYDPNAQTAMLRASGSRTSTRSSFQVRAASGASGALQARITVDPNSLPRIDNMGVLGPQAAALKARVDAASTTTTVESLYQAYFGRLADQSGLTFWTAAIDRGLSPRAVGELFSLSPEFQAATARLANPAFVQAAYQQVLGRAADGNGMASWVKALATKQLTRGGVVYALATSAEGTAHLASLSYVGTAYAVLGGRTPTSASARAHATDLDAGVLRVTVVEDVALEIAPAATWNAAR